MIFVVDMGAKSSHLTQEGINVLSAVPNVIIKSNLTHIAGTLDSMGISYTSCDDLYESSSDFDQLNADIVGRLQSVDGDVALCVVGQSIYDSTVQLMCQLGVEYTAVSGVSVSAPLMPYVNASVVSFTADQLLEQHYIDSNNIVVMYIDDIMVASAVKLRLLELFDYDSAMYVTNGVSVNSTTLSQLDKLEYSYQTSILVCSKPLVDKQVFGYSDVHSVMRVLRSADGCPWDRAQTHSSIASNAVEEAYELVDALDRQDIDCMVEELGDVLLQVLFHQAIALEEGEIEPSDIYSRLGRKLVSRHTHVFGNATATDDNDALDVWNKQKQLEHKIKDTTANIVDVPRSMSAILRADKIQSRASKGGYDFVGVSQAVDKLHEEISELVGASTDHDKLMEAGDVLFACINVIRLMGISSEIALVASTNKFVNRVTKCEKLLAGMGKQFNQLDAEQFDQLWSEAKQGE